MAHPTLRSSLGPVSYLSFHVRRLLGLLGREYKLHPRPLTHPVFLRSHSSDQLVFWQILAERQYSVVTEQTQRGLVVDCGANIGLASAWFLSCFPECHVVSIEPDADNFRQLEKNMSPYGSRCTPMHAAVWTSSVELTMQHESSGAGREWGRKFTSSEGRNEQSVKGIEIASILERSRYDRISLLKIDIEGAEAEIFSDPRCHQWLSKTDLLAIELHDNSVFGNCYEAFDEAISHHRHERFVEGELTICHMK